MAAHSPRRVTTLVYPPDFQRPDAWGHFIQHPTFTDDWRRCQYTDEDLMGIEAVVRLDTKSNPGIPGAGGIKDTCYQSLGGYVICVWYMCFEDASTMYLLALDDGCMECDMTENDLLALRLVAAEVQEEMSHPRRV